ncbi:putative heme d1 biosynthesis radical SAM protein NirJ1 [Natroniella acetigena]|uniref:putative heme d1 biosynthesis radical SAM protein NirJ1 n=1 Tax=Natroniella acetigena TaxID=52004 RepID=UPI00200A2FF1|nr:putative heme d1 biosynthesis radical SAM protein NirJ1 [Natroniella acetigena]MCK8826141.1 putative heme d1 biosynthesis radical SAM protein NirJ1 [Natroniella acetigena]
MIGVSKLLGGKDKFGDKLRYSKKSKGQRYGTKENRGPVVVWNMTRTCNLSCTHCYSDSDYKGYSGELTTAEAKKFIDDLVEFNVPVLLFSGGEPLIRKDIFELADYTAQKGIRPTISTNGTLITKDVARRLKDIGVGYVGISLDGMEATNDRFRGKKGAFKEALQGIHNCLEIDQKVGLRFTINRHNYQEVGQIFDLLEEENIPRACFYHLVYSGRGSEMVQEDISLQQSREVMDLIIERTLDFQRRGLDKEILTVDNHADGIYTYLKMKEEAPAKAEKILKLLQRNGGNRTGIAIANVDWQGNVHPDQFTQNHTFGNIRERKFSEIWTDSSQNNILAGLKERKKLLKGRCSSCKWLEVCNGNFRARAEAIHGDFWHEDPACYLTDEEVGLSERAMNI